MNLLLDTHIALWAITDSPRLSKMARRLIEDSSNSIWISTASTWEIAIKHALGRGDMPLSGNQAAKFFQDSGYRFLPVSLEHSLKVESLPSHHHDPFDRIIIAQAMCEPMQLLTSDPIVARYENHITKV